MLFHWLLETFFFCCCCWRYNLHREFKEYHLTLEMSKLEMSILCYLITIPSSPWTVSNLTRIDPSSMGHVHLKCLQRRNFHLSPIFRKSDSLASLSKDMPPFICKQHQSVVFPQREIFALKKRDSWIFLIDNSKSYLLSVEVGKLPFLLVLHKDAFSSCEVA